MNNLRSNKPYRFSFTAASLLIEDFIVLARHMVNDNIPIDDLKHEMMSRERKKTSKREFAEMYLRLKTLSEKELDILVNGSGDDQKLISLIAFGRAYEFFRDFIAEVVMEKVLVYDLQISDMDYNIFFNRKSIDHDELEKLADSTKGKIKQVIIKVLHQAGIIDNVKDRNIIIPIVDRSVEKAVAEVNPEDLKILLYTDQKILSL